MLKTFSWLCLPDFFFKCSKRIIRESPITTILQSFIIIPPESHQWFILPLIVKKPGLPYITIERRKEPKEVQEWQSKGMKELSSIPRRISWAGCWKEDRIIRLLLGWIDRRQWRWNKFIQQSRGRKQRPGGKPERSVGSGLIPWASRVWQNHKSIP